MEFKEKGQWRNCGQGQLIQAHLFQGYNQCFDASAWLTLSGIKVSLSCNNKP